MGERMQDVEHWKQLRESFKRVIEAPSDEALYQEVGSWAAYMNQQEATIRALQSERDEADAQLVATDLRHLQIEDAELERLRTELRETRNAAESWCRQYRRMVEAYREDVVDAPDLGHVPLGPRRPTDAEIDDACMWYRHDYGLLEGEERKAVRAEAVWWLRAWTKVEGEERVEGVGPCTCPLIGRRLHESDWATPSPDCPWHGAGRHDDDE